MPSLFSFQDNDRSIFFFDQVHQWTAESVISDLIRMNDEDKEKPIHLFINSRGGNLLDLFSIVDVMKAISAPIHTYALGMAASAGSLLVGCGTKGKRFISTNSEIMIHEAAITFYEFDTRDDKNTKALEELQKRNDKVNQIYAQVTGKSVEEIGKILGSKDDIWMNAEESVKFGLVDEVMTEDDLNKIKLSESFKTIKLSESFALNEDEAKENLKTVHLLKVCSLKDRGVEITPDTLSCLIANFNNNVRGQDISIEYNTHDNDDGQNPAAAWIKKLFLKDGDNKNLFGKVEYSPTAKKMIEDKEYKYLSVEIDPLYQDEKGKLHNNVLLGATFTNRPAVKGLKPLKLSENINNNKKIDMELTKDEISSIENIKSEMKIEIKDFHKSFSEMKTTNSVLMSEKKELTANKTKIEAETKTAKEALVKIQKEQIDGEKISATDSLIEKGIIMLSQKEKVLDKFSSKSEIEDFYEGLPAIVSVKPKGGDLEDPSVNNKIQELAKQTGQSEEDIIKYGLKKLKK